MAIKTLESLRHHLQAAIELEHATIPAYLTAMYTIEPRTNEAASTVLRSVVLEEMLHLVLAGNVLNAVGGHPAVCGARFVPSYPGTLPYHTGGVVVSLAKFCPENLDVFLRIEKPEATRNGLMKVDGESYDSIGAFYQAILQGLRDQVREHGPAHVFTGERGRQITPDLYYGGGGEVIEVFDLASAEQALHVIIDQGEGLPKSIWDQRLVFDHPRELAHYFRFNQIEQRRYYQPGDTAQGGPTGAPFPVQWERVYNIKPNPKSADYPEGSEVHAASDQFNEGYSALLRGMHEAFNGRPNLLFQSVSTMYALRERALALIKNPYPGHDGFNAGPSFEYVAPR